MTAGHAGVQAPAQRRASLLDDCELSDLRGDETEDKDDLMMAARSKFTQTLMDRAAKLPTTVKKAKRAAIPSSRHLTAAVSKSAIDNRSEKKTRPATEATVIDRATGTFVGTHLF